MPEPADSHASKRQTRAVFDLSVLRGETDHPYRRQYEQSRYPGQLVLGALGVLPSVTIHFSTTVTDLRRAPTRCKCGPRHRAKSRCSPPGALVMSCNLCLAWQVVEALDGEPPRAATLEPWLRGEGWTDRIMAQQQNQRIGGA